MRPIFLAGCAALAMLAAPISLNAQTESSTVTTAEGRTYTLTPEQQTLFNGWTAEQRASYDGWPYEAREYYWSLTGDQPMAWWALTDPQRLSFVSWPVEYRTYYLSLPAERQKGYWALSDSQRGMVYKMSPEQQEKAWAAVAAQMAGQTPATPADQANPPGMGTPTTGVPDPQAAAQAVPPAMPADASYQGGPYKGALTPPPETAMNKTYPVCTSKLQDSCRNRGGR
ncbi:hypothetical protein [Novosphingobium sp.]|uniref:hypothetical protein n=1 Tax=Novosphingobium sp. TaxID=1874826 RepID=UPI00286DC241|nr:hypothetical protein [Novosphingobium sp.]